MKWSDECAVVVPCLNEEASIASVVAVARRKIPTVFVVDDGSTDSTAAGAKKAGAKILRHERTRGKGASLQTGLAHAHKLGFIWAMTMDGDDQHSPKDISLFLNCAEKTSAHLVIGNRMHDSAHMPLVRWVVNRWMSKRISHIAGQPLPDSQCGFRLIHLDSWAALPISAKHFEIESEMLLAFALNDRRIEFVPIQVIYKNERSKIHPLRDTIRWFRWWRAARRSIFPRQNGISPNRLKVKIQTVARS